jgi:subtilisin family serine protease
MHPGVRVFIATAVVASTACMAFGGNAASHAEPRLVLSGSATSDGAVGSHTPSGALDRMTKREPRLDGTVRRAGTGRGVTIYVFDGGISAEHVEFGTRLRIGFDAFPSKPRICNDHGTAVAGAAAGATLGVAPDAEIVDVKIINCERMRGSTDAIVAAARWTVEDHARHPETPAVANWSFVVDTSREVPEIDSAVALLHDAGILVVVAAGNFDMDACRVSPASAPGAFVVGASSLVRGANRGAWLDARSENTANGPCIDVYAPGDSVLLPGVENGRSTVTAWSGTSMAAGYASGAASLVLERSPHATPELVAETIVRTATAGMVDERLERTSSIRAPLLYVGPLRK